MQQHGNPEPAPDISQFGYKQELKRSLSLWNLIVYGLIFMVPIAPFGIYGFILAQSRGMVALVYLVGMAAMIFTAFSYASMSRAFPIAGSVYAYAGRGINAPVGFLAGWAILLDYTLDYTLVPGPAVHRRRHGHDLVRPGDPGVGLCAGLHRVEHRHQLAGHAGQRQVQPADAGGRAGGAGDLRGHRPVCDRGSPGRGGAVHQAAVRRARVLAQPDLGAVSVAVLSFLGFDAISTLSEEIRGGAKTVGRATVSALLIVGLLLMVQTWVAAMAVPQSRLHNPNTAFYDAAGIIGGHWLSVLTALAGPPPPPSRCSAR